MWSIAVWACMRRRIPNHEFIITRGDNHPLSVQMWATVKIFHVIVTACMWTLEKEGRSQRICRNVATL